MYASAVVNLEKWVCYFQADSGVNTAAGLKKRKEKKTKRLKIFIIKHNVSTTILDCESNVNHIKPFRLKHVTTLYLSIFFTFLSVGVCP